MLGVGIDFCFSYPQALFNGLPDCSVVFTLHDNFGFAVVCIVPLYSYSILIVSLKIVEIQSTIATSRVLV